ncbi:hypothetical protein HYALB_00000023 [Hymenoscyphus albidus]|uniref:Uncharacterized protein n=1 Tax=Hymenoscyphus albidus TaxID=595503 RepID=A0A9N9Q3D3_9HELO|nr:hypothetical protein HYALB_00000023 [Hymenoscyphus albidus]
MDVRGLDGSQSQSERPGNKRPWDEARTSSKGNVWHGAPLPPMDAVPPHRHVEKMPNSYSPYSRELSESEAKRPKYDRSEHRGNYELNGQLPHSPARQSMYASNQEYWPPPPPSTSGFAQQQKPVVWETMSKHPGHPPVIRLDSPESTNLCRRCKKVLGQHEDVDMLESSAGESIESVTQAAAAALTQLAETLGSGISSEQRVACLSPGQRKTVGVCPTDFPLPSKGGLTASLSWLLERLQQANSLADKLVRHVPQGVLSSQNGDFSRDRNLNQRINGENMKRRWENDIPNQAFDIKVQANTTQRASRIGERPSISSQYDQHQPQPSEGSRIPTMNPPHGPGRQLPSPPGRSIPSPTSLNFPSPLAPTFGNASQPVNLPPPSAIHQSPINGFLPPIGGSHSDSAMQTLSASLQHEVSVQKIALSTLQAEHDKLLAAYLRSQTRASALEKKHNVSDAEIISLTEEKIRLQSQVMELEKDIEDISKSRDECRQSAVAEVNQYVDMVKKATQLEIMAAEDRKNWNSKKAELEKRIEMLRIGSLHKETSISTGVNTPNTSVSQEAEGITAAFEALDRLRREQMGEGVQQLHQQSTSEPQTGHVEKVRVLEEEVNTLRNRCMEMEKALHNIRDNSRSMEGLVEALGLAGKTILDQATKILGD